MTREQELESLLYDAVVELSYVQEAEDHSQCASSKGRNIVNQGMELLRVPDLSEEQWSDVLSKRGRGGQ